MKLGTATVVLAALTSRCLADDGGALVVPPSQYFEGNDGPWSTFDIRLGTPEQYMRVLVSTASPQTMVPLDSDGCSQAVFGTIPSDCAVSRGGLFSYNESSSWADIGLHAINGNGVGLEANLGYTLRTQVGLETLGLGLNGPVMANQTVAGFATPSPFYLGVLGLNGQPFNASTLGNYSAPALLTALKGQKRIPSLSWSYTAGARYRLKQVYGQLIFSGYDESRFTPNSASFSMAGDVTRDLVVVLQSISYTGPTSTQLLSDPIDIYIDSTDPNLWLPASVCDAFEAAFSLTLDETSGLYLINDSHHEALLDADAQVTFRISDVKNGGEQVAIRLPYAAFDLMAENPLVDGKGATSRYFPLKRAANETQYTLGRTFLQEAYLSADYERNIFNVSACTWQEGAEPNIVTIPSRDGNTGSPSSDDPSSSGSNGSSNDSRKGLSTGQIAGIAVGSTIAGLLILALIAFCVLRQRRRWIGAGFAVADTSKAEKKRSRRDSVLDGPVFNAGSSRRGHAGGVGAGVGATPWNADDISGSGTTDSSPAGSHNRGIRNAAVAARGGSGSGTAPVTRTTTRSNTSASTPSTGSILASSHSGSGGAATDGTTPELAGTEVGPLLSGTASATPIAANTTGGGRAGPSLAPVAEHVGGGGTYELPGTEVSRSKSGRLRVVEDFSVSGVPEHRYNRGSSGAGDISPVSTRLVPRIDTSGEGGRGSEGRRVVSVISPTTP